MKKKILKIQNNVVLYQTKSGSIEFRGDIQKETIWATRMQMGQVFGVNPQAITKHLRNIYKEKELGREATSSKMELVQNESGRLIRRTVDIYNLDAIIAVGYRINSLMGTKFRIWATKTLREYLVKGYVLNKKVILKNYDQFLKNVSDIQALLPSHVTLDPKMVLELVKEYSVTWAKLDAYDRDALKPEGMTKKKIKLQAQELSVALDTLKKELIQKKEATQIFGQERNRDSIGGIIGNVMQSFGGKEVYPTLEEKAAHLLYFVVKNHPFVDGNKRSGAFAFIWFLRKNGVKGARNINPSGLTALTVLIAESDPKQKEKMVALVVELLRVGKN